MDDYFDLDGSFSGDFNWADVPNIDVSGVGVDLSNLGSGSGFNLDDIPFNLDFNLEDVPFNYAFDGYDIPDTPFNYAFDGYDILDTPFNSAFDGYDILDTPFNSAFDGYDIEDTPFNSDFGTGSVSTSGSDGKDGANTKDTSKVTDIIKNIVGDTKKNNNAALLAALLGGLLGLMGKPKVGGAKGYQGKPAGASPMTATRTALPVSGAPGAGGKRFMTDVAYAAEGGLMGLGYQPNQNVTFMAAGGMPKMEEYLAGTKGLRLGNNRNYDRLIGSGYSVKDALRTLPEVGEKELARGGLSSLGSYSDGGRMLKGPGDGMSDDIPASIEGKRPARLANDEFVVPADVVSHLGNGSSDAGAKVLYDMMAKVRKARTGNPKQGKQINPKKYVPA
jgi:hypothetical protein